ncbi:EpsG family protein [Sphingobacterium multivorum]|uniref:EpsG family protein n=1 Tax=Sphingobacterium multivorum TaxID=28454 RepID=UPI003DA36531
MEFYYSIFIIGFLLCFFDFVDIRVVKNALYFLFCAFLVIITGLRSIGIDNDSRAYEAMFNFYGTTSVPLIIKGGFGYVEKGYVFLNHYLYKLGFTFRTFLFLISVVTGYLNFRYYQKKSNFIFLSLLFHLSFFYLYRDFTQIRYAFACSILFWSVESYLNKSYKWSLLIFFIALSMHNSSIILIPALLFMRYVDNKYIYILLPLPCLILGKVLNVFNYLSNSYLSTEHMTIYQNDQSGGSLSISIIGYFLVLLYMLANYSKRATVHEKKSYFYWKLVALSVSLNFLVFNISIFQRFSFILFQFSVILLPFILDDFRLNFLKKDHFFMLYFLFSLLLLLYGLRMIDINLIRPYTTI